MATTMETRVVRLLEQQYDLTLNYCNALTALHNLTVNSVDENSNQKTFAPPVSSLIHQALEDVMETVALVQRHRQALQDLLVETTVNMSASMPTFSPRWRDAFSKHVERTKRILATIHQTSPARYAPNGIPLAPSSDGSSDSQLLALSALRASVQQVLELVGETAAQRLQQH